MKKTKERSTWNESGSSRRARIVGKIKSGNISQGHIRLAHMSWEMLFVKHLTRAYFLLIILSDSEQRAEKAVASSNDPECLMPRYSSMNEHNLCAR